jgi:class 3 adenylate cyclase
MDRVVCPVLVGREREVTELEDALLDANRGDGQIVLLAGEAGVGKSRLAAELERRARKIGMTTLSGGCSEADLALPYLPFLEALGNYLTGANVEKVRRDLGSLSRELAHLFPQLEPDATRETGDPTQAKLRLFEAIIALLRIAADHSGLLLVLEDLHWSDDSTRELLDYLTRRLRGTRIMVLGTYRADELHRKHPLAHLIQAWRRTKAANVIELQPLPPDGVAAMMRAIFDESEITPEFSNLLHERSEGNPFVLEELLKAAIDSGDIYRKSDRWERKGLEELRLPQTVRDTILLRLEKLSPEQAEILQTASVLGRSFTYPVLVAVSAGDDRSVQAALHASVQQQLLEEEPKNNGRYRFRHALTREAIYEDMIAPRREELHGIAADVLTARAETAPIDLAFHLLAANRWSDAVPMGIKAAEEAERNQANREAAQVYERLLIHVKDGPMRAQLLCRTGSAYHRANEPARAQRFLEQGIPLLEAIGQEVEASGYRIILGRCYWERSQPATARAEYERARAVLERAGPSEALANAYIRLAGLHMFELQFDECLAMANRAAEVAAAAGAEAARIWAGVFVGGALANLGQVDEGFRRMDLAHSESVAHGLTGIAANALYNGAVIRVRMFRAREALDRLRLFEGLRVGTHATHLELLATGSAWQCLGYPDRAHELQQQALVLARETQTHTFEAWIRRDLAVTIGALGRPDEGLKAIGPVGMNLELQDLVLLLRETIRLQMDAGDIAGAEVNALTILSRPVWPAYEARMLGDAAVEVFVRVGRIDEADEIVSRGREGDPIAQSMQDRMEGRLALAKGDFTTAREMLLKAASAFEACSYALEEMRTRRSLAEAHVKAGDRAAAEAELRKVVRIADEHGAIFEGDQARAALNDMGVEQAGEGSISLSPSGETVRERGAKEAEERVVTVMFADVRGYTEMVTNEAPADLVDRVSSFHRWARQEIERHHGVVDKYAGDAVMATFNVSGARLDHALQALQAAMAIRDKANAAGLPVGIGIAVGAAVVGSLTAEANMSAIGEVTNLASRLQGQAAAGEVILSAEAYKRTRDWLTQHSKQSTEESLTLKGFAEAVPAHRLS